MYYALKRNDLFCETMVFSRQIDVHWNQMRRRRFQVQPLSMDINGVTNENFHELFWLKIIMDLKKLVRHNNANG